MKINGNPFIKFAFMLLFSCSLYVSGQGFYINMGGGYGFDASAQTIDNDVSMIYNSIAAPYSYDSTFSNENVKGSLGKGFNYGVSFGYMFNDNISAEIGVSYLSGAKITATYYYKDFIDQDPVVTTYTHNASTDYSASMLRIMPALKFGFGHANFKPYMKAGLVIGISPSIQVNYLSDQQIIIAQPFYNFDNLTNETTKFSQGGTLGFMGAVGAEFKLYDMYFIYGEVGMISQTWAPAHSEVTAYTQNGSDVMGTLTPYEKETNYGDKYSSSGSSAATQDQGTPRQALKAYWPFSSWGINVGIHILLQHPRPTHTN